MIHKNLFGALALTALTLTAPVAAKAAPQHNRPRIVVTMMVDQMTWDYLYRYQARFVEGGFKRLLTQGFNCENTRINYIPAYTAIGHSSVHTGSVPSIHGIAGNDFFKDGNPIYCTQDTTVSSVGVPNGVSGQMSPRNLLTTTISDELRIATNFRSKTIGVAIKDRASILPAGHTANGAYWLDDKTGNFITSTYYMQDLPEWVKKFNARGRVAELLKDGWNTLYPIDTYRESTADAVPYEQPWDKDGKFPATLPLNTAELAKVKGPGVIRTTPMGNTLTFEMAKAAIEGESLGSRADETDFLAMSHSATDYVGTATVPSLSRRRIPTFVWTRTSLTSSATSMGASVVTATSSSSLPTTLLRTTSPSTAIIRSLGRPSVVTWLAVSLTPQPVLISAVMLRSSVGI